ncbi:MAG: sulfotransferase domain-containing protein [Bacteroidota bacterium]
MIGKWNKRRIELPDFIIPGAAKSGTTTLYRILQQHPEVFVPSYHKETYFFSFFNRELTYEKEFQSHLIVNPIEYCDLFKGQSNKLMGEASIGYLYDFEDCIQNMQKFYGEKTKEVKIIIILRNPIDRAFSHYNFLIRNGFETLPFKEAIQKDISEKRKKIRPGFDYLDYGKYYKQVKAFIDYFDHVKVFLFEDLKDFDRLSSEMFQFLEVDEIKIAQPIKANPSGVPRSKFLVKLLRKNKFLAFVYRNFPLKMQDRLLNFRDRLLAKMLKRNQMDEEMRKHLSTYFEQDIRQLQKLIKRDLSHWLMK